MDAQVLCGAAVWDTTLALLGFLTRRRDPAWGQCLAGSLDWGGSPPKGYRRRPKVPSEWLENHSKSAKGRRELDCDTDGWGRYESRA